MERGGHGHPGQRPLRGHRRPPVDAGVGHQPLRDGLQPLLPGHGTADGPGDQVFFQGHATPGIYARAFLEGRLGEDQVDRFRREIGGGGACPATPTPGSCPTSGSSRRCRWAWARSTPSTRPGSTATWPTGASPTPAGRTCGASWATASATSPSPSAPCRSRAREGLDNLIFVVNCNLQRLDGPVRGNGKVIQELESVFRGAGWNVIKVVWGSRWDELLAADVDGRPRRPHEHHPRRRVPEVRGGGRGLRPGALLRRRPPPAAPWSSACPTTSPCSPCPGAATTGASSTPPTPRPWPTRVRPR